MRKTIAPIALAIAGLVCTTAFADPPPPPVPTAPNPSAAPQRGMRGNHQGGMMADLRQLDLTSDQRRSIVQALRAHRQETQDQTQSLQQKRNAYDAAVPGSPGYQPAVDALAQAESDAARTRVTQEADLRAKIYAVLTPDQRTQLAQMQAQHKAQMQQSHARQGAAGQSAAQSDGSSQ
jgi:periplasmic protein CpxP/Spy